MNLEMQKFDSLKTFVMYFERGNTARVANSIEDALAIKNLIRQAWYLNDYEQYFYTDFNDENVIFERHILPILQGKKISELSCVPLVLCDSFNKIIFTMSMLFNHKRKSMELGRGAADITSMETDKLHFMMQFAESVNRQTIKFSIILDCITLYNTPYCFASFQFCVTTRCTAILEENVRRRII